MIQLRLWAIDGLGFHHAAILDYRWLRWVQRCCSTQFTSQMYSPSLCLWTTGGRTRGRLDDGDCEGKYSITPMSFCISGAQILKTTGSMLTCNRQESHRSSWKAHEWSERHDQPIMHVSPINDRQMTPSFLGSYHYPCCLELECVVLSQKLAWEEKDKKEDV